MVGEVEKFRISTPYRSLKPFMIMKSFCSGIRFLQAPPVLFFRLGNQLKSYCLCAISVRRVLKITFPCMRDSLKITVFCTFLPTAHPKRTPSTDRPPHWGRGRFLRQSHHKRHTNAPNRCHLTRPFWFDANWDNAAGCFGINPVSR